jgi:hypothetical protein
MVDWPVAAAATVVETRVGGYDAEVVTGGWGFEETVFETGDARRRWSIDASSIFIRWQAEDWYYSVFYDQPYNTSGMNDPGTGRIDLEELIEIVESAWMGD